MAVVGNKCDVEHQRSVKRDRSHKFAADNGFPSHDVSARTGEAVETLQLMKFRIIFCITFERKASVSGVPVHSQFGGADLGRATNENRPGLSQTDHYRGNR